MKLNAELPIIGDKRASANGETATSQHPAGDQMSNGMDAPTRNGIMCQVEMRTTT